MNIHLVLVLPSGEGMQKTYRSSIRPVTGDVIDDPGFDPAFHNGYEVVKVTLNYASEECWVSLAPLAIEVQHLGLEAYVEKLRAHGWKAISREV